MTEEKKPSGLWKRSKENSEGKYLVQRRDGTVPEWPNFVLGARDPAAPAAIRAYAEAGKSFGFNEQYISDLFDLANEFEEYLKTHGPGDPDKGKHRVDDPEIIRKMTSGKGS